jgi:hypothetical protein
MFQDIIQIGGKNEQQYHKDKVYSITNEHTSTSSISIFLLPFQGLVALIQINIRLDVA